MNADTRREIEALFERYPEKRGALLPAIYLLQAEKGWVDTGQARELAGLFEISPVEVYEVLTFYNMFYTRPQGRHHVYVCTNLSCSLRGARGLLRQVESRLAIHAGETTPDGRITLGHEECLGSCGTAPVMRVDGVYHENVDGEAVDRLLEGLD